MLNKVVHADGGSRIVPEYEACRQIAESKGLALRDVYETVLHRAKPMIQVVQLSKNLLVAPIWGQQPLDKTQAKL